MRRGIRSIVPGSALLLVAAGAAPQAAVQGRAPRPDAAPAAQEEEQVQPTLVEQMQGAWRLTDVFDPLGNFEIGFTAGYVLVVDGYMSFELHTRGRSPVDSAYDDFISTGTYTLDFDAVQDMTITTLIGSTSFNYEEEVEYEPPGTQRRYRAQVGEQSLVLERIEAGAGYGTRFSFTRLPTNVSGRLDFFGRPVDAEGNPVRRQR